MRLIDADALIEEYGDWYTEEGEEHGFIGTIEDLVRLCQTIEPEREKGKWIPCSERLPEEGYVLISKKPKKYFDGGRCVTIAIRMEDPRSRKVNWRDIGFDVIPDDNVLAWMPLPEPYREESEKHEGSD